MSQELIMRNTLTLAVALGALLASACSLEQHGLLSISLSLDAVPLTEVPGDLAEAVDPFELSLSTGNLDIDGVNGLGTLTAELPEPPEGYAYVPVLSLATGSREGLPEVEGGHDDGPGDHGGHGEEEASLEMVALDALRAVGDHTYAGAFTDADVTEAGITAIRAAMVMLAPVEGELLGEDSLMLLHGVIDFTGDESGSPEEEAGHSHGV